MKIVVRNIRTPISVSEKEVREQAARRLSPLISSENVVSTAVYRRSVDVRHGKISFVYSVLVESIAEVSETELLALDSAVLTEADPLDGIVRGDEVSEHRPVIVGFGPCGMFCALLLAEAGYRPIVIERGDNVLTRSQRVGIFLREGVLDTESNVQFGAGGAGTFSDGKLVTRINDIRTGYVIKRLYSLGAPAEILTQAKPHIGTDKLLSVVANADRRIRELGGEILYRTRFEGTLSDPSGRVVGVRTTSGDIACSQLVIAIGHSARDTVSGLRESGFEVVSKPFSVGVRIEHLRSDIERAVYGSYAGDKRLGAAEYALSRREGEECVYTFCMCPGGEVIAAASEEGGVVVNGMSRFRRDGINSNSALVVAVQPQGDPIEFQRRLERKAFELGGGNYVAPVQTVGDFLKGKSGTTPSRVLPTYRGGAVREADLRKLFPKNVNTMLERGLRYFNGRLEGFASPTAVMTGVESRTSSPVRVLRSESLTAVGFDNVYPAGEGAGYAGGITSAAVDGIRVAEAIISRYKPCEKN